MYLQKEKLTHVNSIAHEGKVVVFATDTDDGKTFYTVKQDGFEYSYLNTPANQRTGLENWQTLEFPDQKVDDLSVINKEKAELTYQKDTNKFILRSHYRTKEETSVTKKTTHSHPINQLQTITLLEEQLLLKRLSQGHRCVFWQLWQQHQDYLYDRCFIWMGRNHTDAEEAFSQATLKAWEKLPDYAEKITNLKAWLTRFTHNLCVDIHRHRRKTMAIESIEEIAIKENEAFISSVDSPELAILRHELGEYISRAIDTLSSRLRTPFILHYYHQISYQDIAQKLALSLDNVYKRIQQARKILQKHLSKYLLGLDDSLLNSSEPDSNKCLSVVESLASDEKMISNQAAMATESRGEIINYQVKKICLETLPHAWYRSLNPLGWS